MEHISKLLNSPHLYRATPSDLSLNEQRVYGYMCEYIAKYSQHTLIPVSLRYYYIEKKFNLDRHQVKYIINKLIKRGLVDRYIKYTKTKEGKLEKICYFRLHTKPPIDKIPSRV